MRLYNSLTRTKEEFTPINPGKVGLYTCGPTVYDHPHIGNMRAFLAWDVLKRYLTMHGYEVRHIMNVTDVGHLTSDGDEGEDKIEVAKRRERLSAWDVAKKYLSVFQNDTARLNIIPPTKYVPATDLISDQVAFAKELDDKGFLYRTTDGMYFDTSKLADYGKLAMLDTKNLKAGARVEFKPEKRNVTDFAVWKFSPKGATRDMEWDSPWGVGFPGWHLECSVISRKYLGDTFDIHTGGIDHLTVHHPNEMAQSEAVTGQPQAHYWMHVNFINDRDKKISKSAGTFVKLDDLITGGVDPIAYRFFLLQTHYRKEVAYSWKAIQAAHQGLKNLYREISFFSPAQGSCKEYDSDFDAALSDDLNTPKGLDVLQRLVKSALPSDSKLASVFRMDAVLGLRLKEEWERRTTLPSGVDELLREREEARAEKEWDKADLLRHRLLEKGVEVMDTKEGQRAVLA